MSGCGSLNLLSSDGGRNLPDEDYTRFWPICIEEIKNHFIDFLSVCVCFYPRSLGYLATDSWASRKCQSWARSHGMGLMLDQSLAGHSHKF